MKKISVLVPTLNEEENVEDLVFELEEQLKVMNNYDYEIVFIDNSSSDNTKKIIEDLCSKNAKIKAIFNSRNFGGIRSAIYGILQVTGDCVVMFSADFQDPIELIPRFVAEWEKGYEAVCGVKTSDKEFFLMRRIRALAYTIIGKYSNINHIKHFDGVGLYDRSFIEKVRKLAENDVEIQLRNLVTELNVKYSTVEFEHQKRRKGKSKQKFFGLYNYGINSMISYTKVLPRVSLVIGIIVSILSAIVLLIGLIYGLINGLESQVLLIGISLITFLLGLNLFFIAILGEYIMAINTRIMKRPLVLEEKRINF